MDLVRRKPYEYSRKMLQKFALHACMLCVLCIIAVLMVSCTKECFGETIVYQSDDGFFIKEIPQFLTEHECDALIQLAKKKGMTDSTVYSGSTDLINEDVRKSEQVWLYDHDDTLIANISKRVSRLTRMPVSHQEAMQLLHYEQGGKYTYHYDACKGTEVECERMNQKGGHRLLTVIVYLNDGMDGGTTHFKNINVSVVPEIGKCVVFTNVHPVTQQIYEQSLHAGMPVEKGEKWMLNKWIHARPY